MGQGPPQDRQHQAQEAPQPEKEEEEMIKGVSGDYLGGLQLGIVVGIGIGITVVTVLWLLTTVFPFSA